MKALKAGIEDEEEFNSRRKEINYKVLKIPYKPEWAVLIYIKIFSKCLLDSLLLSGFMNECWHFLTVLIRF